MRKIKEIFAFIENLLQVFCFLEHIQKKIQCWSSISCQFEWISSRQSSKPNSLTHPSPSSVDLTGLYSHPITPLYSILSKINFKFSSPGEFGSFLFGAWAIWTWPINGWNSLKLLTMFPWISCRWKMSTMSLMLSLPTVLIASTAYLKSWRK